MGLIERIGNVFTGATDRAFFRTIDDLMIQFTNEQAARRQCQSDLEEQVKRGHGLAADLAAVVVQRDNLLVSLESEKRALVAMDKAYSEERAAHEHAKDDIAEMSKALTRERAQHAEIVAAAADKHQAEIKRLTDAHNEHTLEALKAVTRERDKLLVDYEEARDGRADAIIESERLESERDDLAATADARQVEILDRDKRIAVLEQSNEAQSAQIAALTTERDNARKGREAAMESSNQFNREAAYLRVERDELRESEEAMRLSLLREQDAHLETIQERDRAIAMQDTIRKETQRMIDSKNDEIAELLGAVHNQGEDIARVMKERDDLSDALTGAEADLSAANKTIAKHNLTFGNNKRSIESRDKKIAKLEDEVKSYQARNKAQAKQLTAAQKGNERLRAELDKVNTE